MDFEIVLRALGPLALAAAAALAADRTMARRGLLPPGFAEPWRRAGGLAVLAGVFYVTAFAALGTVGMEVDLDLSAVQPWELFALHAVLVASMAAWAVLAWAGVGERGGAAEAAGAGAAWREPAAWESGSVPGREPGGLAAALRGFRLAPAHPLGRELALGVGAGVAIWGAVLALLLAIAAAVLALGGEALLPEGPPELVTFVVGQPVWVRVAAALSAGLVEEAFFRGFLQPRIGIVASSLLFVLAHASYGEPFMLVGVALLSVVYALLARRRRDVWAAAAAHAVFDAVQLLVLIPFAVERLSAAGAA